MIIWLNAPLQDIIDRLKKDAQNEAIRPQFTSGNIVQETVDMMKQRIPLYEKAADYTVDTAGRVPSRLRKKFINICINREIWLRLIKAKN